MIWGDDISFEGFQRIVDEWYRDKDFSWEFSTTPAEISKLIEGKRIKPTAILTFDSTRVNAKNLAELEEILYGKDPTSPEGDDGVEPRLPLPDEVIEIMSKENP